MNDKLKLTVSQAPPVLSYISFQLQYYFKCRHLTPGLCSLILKIKLWRCILCSKVGFLLFAAAALMA